MVEKQIFASDRFGHNQYCVGGWGWSSHGLGLDKNRDCFWKILAPTPNRHTHDCADDPYRYRQKGNSSNWLESRFGVAGCWLRFFSQSPELDPNAKNHGSARAIGYQIIRYGLTGSPSSRAKYQLFRSDVSARNTFEAGYNLHPDGGYDSSASLTSLDPSDLGTPRIPSSITNPIVTDGTDYSPTSFSLASNIIDFGIRAYHLEKNSFGTGNLVQIFPPIDISSPGNLLAEEFMAT